MGRPVAGSARDGEGPQRSRHCSSAGPAARGWGRVQPGYPARWRFRFQRSKRRKRKSHRHRARLRDQHNALARWPERSRDHSRSRDRATKPRRDRDSHCRPSCRCRQPGGTARRCGGQLRPIAAMGSARHRRQAAQRGRLLAAAEIGQPDRESNVARCVAAWIGGQRSQSRAGSDRWYSAQRSVWWLDLLGTSAAVLVGPGADRSRRRVGALRQRCSGWRNQPRDQAGGADGRIHRGIVRK